MNAVSTQKYQCRTSPKTNKAMNVGRYAQPDIRAIIHASMNVPTVSPTARPMNLVE